MLKSSDKYMLKHLNIRLKNNFLQGLKRKRLIANKSIKNNFASNDYLNLSQHPYVKKTLQEAAEIYGMGSGASPLICGYQDIHQELEKQFADFVGREKALLFNSGYHANAGLFSVLANRHSTIIADKDCHASLLDGIHLARAQHKRYAHHNMQQVAAMLQQIKTEILIVSESVFSMEGSITKINHLAPLAKKYNAPLIIDDAHGFGVLGTKGKGIAEYLNLKPNDIFALITPLGKALGGFGAMISGSKILIDALLQFAKTYRYSTLLPPAIASGNLAALQILQQEKWRIAKLQENINYFLKEAQDLHLPLINTDPTAIKAILIQDNVLVTSIQKKLLQKGILVASIRPPTVKKALLRISLNCEHTQKNIQTLLKYLKKFYVTQNK